MYNSGIISNRFKDRVNISRLTPKYYVSSSRGNDSNDGLTDRTPWQTLSKVSGFSFSAGDIIAFKCGDTFYGLLNITSSGALDNHITFTSYGSGAKPIINSNSDFSSGETWISDGGGIYHAVLGYGGSTVFNVTENGLMLAKMHQGFDDGVLEDITGSGQWAWSLSADTLYIRTNDDVSPELVDIKFGRYTNTVAVGVSGTQSSHPSPNSNITLNGLDVRGSYYNINIWSNNVNIINCDCKNAYGEAIKVEGSVAPDPDFPVSPWVLDNILIDNNNIYEFGGHGIDNTGGHNVTMSNNLIHDAALNHGWIASNQVDGSYAYAGGILDKNNTLNSIIEYNKIYDSIFFYGAIDLGGGGQAIESTNAIARYNLIDNITATDTNSIQSRIISLLASKQPQFYNNTITNCTVPESTGYGNEALIIGARSQYAGGVSYNVVDPIIKNNIFYNNNLFNERMFSEDGANSVSGLIMDNNLYPNQLNANIAVNLINDQDSKFESTLSGNWTIGAGVTIGIVGDAYEGSGAFETVSTRDENGQSVLAVSGLISGETYTIKVWAKIPLGQSVSDSALLINSLTDTTAWVEIGSAIPLGVYTQVTSIPFVAKATSGIIGVYANRGGGTTGDTITIDNIELGIATISGKDSEFEYLSVISDDLISWQATGQDSNAVEGNPGFVNKINDFNLRTGSPAIDAGEDLGQTKDINNRSISGLPDIGAYEYKVGAPPYQLTPTYFVSVDGSDSNSGTTEDFPWQTLAKVETESSGFTSGDVIAFRGGDEWYGNLTLSNISGTSENPITFTSYGAGKAIITGTEHVTNWVNVSGNIWSADVTGKTPLKVLKDDKSVRLASYPPVTDYGFMTNYINVTSSANISGFTSTDLIGQPDLVGGTVFCQAHNSTIRTATIATFNSGTGAVTLNSGITDLDADDEFWVSDAYGLLTTQDDWYFDKANTLYMYSNVKPKNIRIITHTGTGIDVSNCDYVTFDNLNILGYQYRGMHFDSCETISVNNSETNYAIFEGIRFTGGYNHSVDNHYSIGGQVAINVRSYDTSITNSYITDTWMVKDFTTNESGGEVTSVIFIYTGNSIYNSTIHNSGYIGIRPYGEDGIIKNNIVSQYCLTIHDGGGIYTWDAQYEAPHRGRGTLIDGNIVLQENVDRSGNSWYDYGLYADDYSHEITWTNNTVVGGRGSIFLHNGRDLVVTGNTAYMSASVISPLTYKEDVGYQLASGNTISNNDILFESSFSMTLQIKTGGGNDADYGVSDYNAFYNVSRTNLDVVRYEVLSGITDATLPEWQALKPTQDQNSISSGVQGLGNHEILYNKTAYPVYLPIPDGDNWKDLWGRPYKTNGRIEIQPYSGKILIQITEGLVNGDFSDGETGWDLTTDNSGTESAIISGGTLTFNRPSDGSDPKVYNNFVLTSGVVYTATFDLVSIDYTPKNIAFGTENGSSEYHGAMSTTGTKTYDFTPNADGRLKISHAGAGPSNYVLDNISVVVKV